MTENTLLAAWANKLLDPTIMQIFKIDYVNHDPHPYMITPKHLEYADMFLDDAALRRAEAAGVRCGVSGCRLSYHEHKSDKVAFVRLHRDMTGDEAQAELLKINERFEAEGVAGYAFLDHGYRIE